METILVSLISMALIVVSTLGVTLSTLKSANKMADAWQAMEQRSSSMVRTEISAAGPANYQGGIINVTVQNIGQVSLQEFASWDVILQYQSGSAVYLTYSATSTPGFGQWTMNGIFVAGGAPAAFDPGILDPGEYMTVSVNPSSPIPAKQMAKLTISTPNGVTTQCYITSS